MIFDIFIQSSLNTWIILTEPHPLHHSWRLRGEELVGKYHDDVIQWKHFPRYWPFVRGIHRSSVNSPHKGQWHGALMLSFICTWINSWINNREAGDLRRHHAHYGVIVMYKHHRLPMQFSPLPTMTSWNCNVVCVISSLLWQSTDDWRFLLPNGQQCNGLMFYLLLNWKKKLLNKQSLVGDLISHDAHVPSFWCMNTFGIGRF